MNLGEIVLDKQLLDVNNRRCGKVDNLALEFRDDHYLEVLGILTQHGALASDMGRTARWASRTIYRLLGVANPSPVFIPWSLVAKIDVVVHLSRSREELGLRSLQEAIARRFISRLPGA